MGLNYDTFRNRLNKIQTKHGIPLAKADKITDDIMILVEDTIWDGADRWAFKALRDKWVVDKEWRNQEELATSITTHILTYWNEKIADGPFSELERLLRASEGAT